MMNLYEIAHPISHIALAGLSNYNMVFRGVENPLTPGGKRFSTSLLSISRIYVITNVTMSDCSSACDIDTNCLGFFYRINSDGVTTTCNALNNVGTAVGIATTTNSFSYIKTVRFLDKISLRIYFNYQL